MNMNRNNNARYKLEELISDLNEIGDYETIRAVEIALSYLPVEIEWNKEEPPKEVFENMDKVHVIIGW